MPPPKVKLHKTTGRLKKINITYTSSSANDNRENQVTLNNQNIPNAQANRDRNDVSTTRSIPAAESPASEQFELEVYWCIQTIENSLSSGKLNAKQAQDAEKTLKSLKRNGQPMVRKRQIMQSAFGDYRQKMADEEKKMRVGNTTIQFVGTPTKEQNSTANQGHFVKKSFTSSLGNNTNFQFNFPIDAMKKLSIDESTENKDSNIRNSTKLSKNDKAETEIIHQKGNESQSVKKTTTQQDSNPFLKSKFITSDNLFKFNFAVNFD